MGPAHARGGISLLLAALALLAGVAAGCGGDQEEEARPPAPLVGQLALLPDQAELRRRLLFADLGRLRAAYPDPAGFRSVLAGVWLPDALAGANRPLWRRNFGIDLASIERFAAAGFHPAQLLVASGRFRPRVVRARLHERGYRASGGMLRRGADGAIDARTPAGRLALSSLDRVVVTRARLTAASTTALAEAAAAPLATLAEDADFAAAAEALGETTAAAFFPTDIIRPLEGALVIPIARHPSVLLAIGLDDRGPDERVVKLVLVYADPADAREDAKTVGEELAATPLPSRPGQRFGDVLEGLEVSVRADRALLVSGELRAGENAGLWRSLLEGGDLSALVRRA